MSPLALARRLSQNLHAVRADVPPKARYGVIEKDESPYVRAAAGHETAADHEG